VPMASTNLGSKGLLKIASLYSLSNVANSALPFLILPILTRYLTPEDYGITAMFLFAVGVTNPLLSSNLNLLMQKKTVSLGENELSQFIWSGMALILGSLLIGICLIEIPWVAERAAELTFLPTKWLIAILICSAFQGVTVTLLSYFQTKAEPGKYAMLQIGNSVTIVAFTLFFVVGLDMNWKGRILAILAATTVIGLIALRYFARRFVFSAPKWSIAKGIWLAGIALVPHTIGFIIISMGDRYLVSQLVSVEAAGVYAVAVQFAILINLFGDGVYKAMMPWIFKKLAERTIEASTKLSWELARASSGILVAAAVWSFTAPYLIHFLVGKEFQTASQFVAPLSFAWAFHSIHTLYANVFFYADATYPLGILSGVVTVFGIFLCVALIKFNGPLGAAYANLATFALLAAGTYVYGKKKEADLRKSLVT
jgi:O-antigen/teichoic acid export membrane protein